MGIQNRGIKEHRKNKKEVFGTQNPWSRNNKNENDKLTLASPSDTLYPS
jgi:hypothetical protein